jgi:DNA-binding transcriptional regulator YiaG
VVVSKEKDDTDDKKADMENPGDDDLDDKDDASTRPTSPVGMPVTQEQIEQLSAKLEKSWKSLGTELGVTDEVIKNCEEKCSKTQEQALKMLSLWMVSDAVGGSHFSWEIIFNVLWLNLQESEGEKATCLVLEQALREIGQQELAEEISASNPDTDALKE